MSPAPENGQVPHLIDLLWIFAVVTIALALTAEYGEYSRPLDRRTVRHILLSQVFASVVSLGAVAITLYTLHVPPYSRVFVFTYLASLLALAAGYRLMVRDWLMRRRNDAGAVRRRQIIAGRPEGIVEYIASARMRESSRGGDSRLPSDRGANKPEATDTGAWDRCRLRRSSHSRAH